MIPSNETKIIIGERIRKIREIRNYTQEYVAREMSITASAYGKIERGENDLSLYKM